MTLRAFRQRIERLEKVCACNGFHIIEVNVGTPQLEEEAEHYIAEQTAYAESVNKLPFVFRLNTGDCQTLRGDQFVCRPLAK